MKTTRQNMFVTICIMIIVTLSSCGSPSERSAKKDRDIPFLGVEKIKGCIICNKKLTDDVTFTLLTYYEPKTGKYNKAKVATIMLKSKLTGDTIK